MVNACFVPQRKGRERSASSHLLTFSRSGALNAKNRELLELQALAQRRLKSSRANFADGMKAAKEVKKDLEWTQKRVKYANKLFSNIKTMEPLLRYKRKIDTVVAHSKPRRSENTQSNTPKLASGTHHQSTERSIFHLIRRHCFPSFFLSWVVCDSVYEKGWNVVEICALVFYPTAAPWFSCRFFNVSATVFQAPLTRGC